MVTHTRTDLWVQACEVLGRGIIIIWPRGDTHHTESLLQFRSSELRSDCPWALFEVHAATLRCVAWLTPRICQLEYLRVPLSFVDSYVSWPSTHLRMPGPSATCPYSTACNKPFYSLMNTHQVCGDTIPDRC